MKETTITPVSYKLENQRKNVASTFDLLLNQSCELLKNSFAHFCNSSFVQKAIQVAETTSVLATILYVLNAMALTANCFAAALGGSPSLSMSVQYELFTTGLWFIPFTILLSVSFFKKNF